MQIRSHLVTLLTSIFIFVITFVYCEAKTEYEEKGEEEEAHVLQTAILKYGPPQPQEKYGLPGPEIEFGDKKSSRGNALDGNPENFTHRYRIIKGYYSYTGHYETMEERIVDGKTVVTIRGQVCEEILKSYGSGDFLRTVGYIFDGYGLRNFLIDVTKTENTYTPINNFKDKFSRLRSPGIWSGNDKYTVSTSATSLTRSEKPFAYIELECENATSATCREFRCAAFSSVSSSIQWYFKPCQDNTCEFQLRNRTYTVNGLQTSSNITIPDQESGYLKCFANNTKNGTEVLQEVVPVNHTDQKYIHLQEMSVDKPEILGEVGEIKAHWRIHVRGSPPPLLFLVANNETVSKQSPKYESNITVNEIFLTIKNVSSEDLETQFALFAKNKYENKTLVLTSNITSTMLVKMETDFVNSTNAVVKCRVSSLWPLQIYWIFETCKKNKCTPVDLNETRGEKIKLQSTSYVDLNSTMSGNLVCLANNSKEAKNQSQIVEGDVKGGFDILGPKNIEYIDESTKRLVVDLSKNIVLTCAVSAHNHENVVWANSNMDDITDYRVTTTNAIFSYRVNLSIPNVESTYYCKTRSKTGKEEVKKIQVYYGGFSKWIYAVAFVLVAVLICMSVYIGIKMRNYQKLQKEMEELNIVGLANFEKGALEHLNPNLTIDDQVDLLPYDKRYEFPIEQLKLGEQIGSGAFGVVLKGEAKGIYEGVKSAPVAVKMVNRNIGDVYIRALASELKIMIHLGKHINVVNLLGACTKNIAKRELLVIVEYCRFGNLKQYLLNHRHAFINQINIETEQIDYNIGSDVIGEKDSKFLYITPSLNNSQQTEVTSNGEDEDSKTNESAHYKGDYENINKPVCTRDLLIWSFQIARGMEYLASRKVFHGDLAARNILLTEGNIVKISDFGLSKKMYQKDIYKKSGDEMLPVKWMAIEAITDKIFSVQSDIWSFGVVLWEFFSLGRTPYPGLEYNETFVEKLLNGYRMNAPQYANQHIYDIMMSCWNSEPVKRPSFTKLAQEISSVLDESVVEHYVNMNIGYLQMNSRRFEEQNTDYLSMVSAPDFKLFSGPFDYVNVKKSLEEKEEDDQDTYI